MCQMDANDGCFGPTDKSRERSRAPCPPALVLHAERKSAAGDAEDKVGGCEAHNPQLGGPRSLPPVSHLPLGGDTLQSPLWYRATAGGTTAEPSGREGRLGAKQEQPGLPVCIQSRAHWQALLRGAWVVTLDSHMCCPPVSEGVCTQAARLCSWTPLGRSCDLHLVSLLQENQCTLVFSEHRISGPSL